jgi:hypothetical protein
MFDTLEEVMVFYKTNNPEKHAVIYKEFDKNVYEKNPNISKAFLKADGFGEHAFCWNWHLLISVMPDAFKFLEIGVYKGRVLGTIHLLARQMKKNCEIYGVTPLTNLGDKYSRYDNENYSFTLFNNLSLMNATVDNINIIKGLSTEKNIISEAQDNAQYDIIYIDGSHNYEDVCHDILNYVPMLKIGGYLVMDDASLFLEKPAGQFFGHEDVCRAIRDKIDGRSDLKHIFAVGHNRVWLKCN